MKTLNGRQDETIIDESQSEDDEYQALSNREEYDLEKLMQQCEFTIDNAQAFTEKLSKDSASMDAQNIEKIMASEKAVERLMTTLQISIDETLNLEKKIDNYLSLLKNNNDVIMQVGMKENQYKIEQENKKKLEIYIEEMLNQLDFPKEYEHNLLENDLSSKSGIKECIKAADKLQSCLNANIHPTMTYIIGVQEQKSYLEKIQFKFSERLTSHIINNEFNYYVKIHLANYNPINLNTNRELILPKHELIHDGLFVFQPLVKWLNNLNLDYFLILTDRYENEMKKVYDKEIVNFFEQVKERMSGNKTTRKSINYNQDNFDTISSKDSEISMSEWEEFDSYLERILSAIDPVCSSEQKFCMQFFNIDNQSSNTISNRNSSLNSSILTTSTATANFNLHRRVSNVSANNSISHSISNESQNSNENVEKKLKSLREMMGRLFGILEQEFLSFIIHYDNIDGMFSMYLLVRLTQHVLSAEDKGSFLAKTYGNILINVKRNFDKFMNSQLNEIDQSKITKKQKCGIFTFIKKFEAFAKQAENVYKNSGARRTDIDKWYKILIDKMFNQINTLAKQHHKTPEEMVLLENYHYLHNVLMTLKIACLDQERKETKSRYNEALKDYVSRYFGRPLEKLNVFFKGVQQKVQQGVKEEEIGYQLAFSKQELRKNIEECSLKEVKKGLEEMYRRIGKHISDPDSTLIQVIWRSMQEEFITQYKAIENLIQRCYKDANIKLSFTVDDVLRVFSSIAQQQK